MSDWKALELFEREARVLAAIDHPNIPRHHEYFAYDGARALPPGELGREAIAEERGRPLSLILVQDSVEGRSLQEWIDDDAPLSGLALEAILRTLLDVLTYLHGLHPPLVHRDIKPSNIILTSDGRPFLIDFAHTRDGHTLFDWANLEISLHAEMVMPRLGESWADARRALARASGLPPAPPVAPDAQLDSAFLALEALRGDKTIQEIALAASVAQTAFQASVCAASSSTPRCRPRNQSLMRAVPSSQSA